MTPPLSFDEAYNEWLEAPKHLEPRTPVEAMLEALRLTERNLTSLIDASRPNALIMSPWRDEVRKAIAEATP